MNVLTLRKSLNKIKIFNNVKDVASFCESLAVNRNMPLDDLVAFEVKTKILNYHSKENFFIEGESLIFFEKQNHEVEIDIEITKWAKLLEKLGIDPSEDFSEKFSSDPEILRKQYPEDVAEAIEYNIQNPDNVKETLPSPVIFKEHEEQQKNVEVTTLHIGQPIWGEL